MNGSSMNILRLDLSGTTSFTTPMASMIPVNIFWIYDLRFTIYNFLNRNSKIVNRKLFVSYQFNKSLRNGCADTIVMNRIYFADIVIHTICTIFASEFILAIPIDIRIAGLEHQQSPTIKYLNVNIADIGIRKWMED